jgi:ABC-type multidrug transport system ATPase subunit
MLRLYDPTSGRILFDGVDLRDVAHADLMDQCAIVLQEPFLFPDTIGNNIRLARPDATQEEVVAAAKAANVHSEIMQMERGYETVVARRKDGRGISVGQKQRICIAAALLKNAPILFLDEATSNLDSVSERAVQSAFERLMAGRTSFVIAHRLSTLRSVDRILVLDHGQMVGLASHAELLRDCPTYQRLWVAQMHEEVGEVSPVIPRPRERAVPNGDGKHRQRGGGGGREGGRRRGAVSSFGRPRDRRGAGVERHSGRAGAAGSRRSNVPRRRAADAQLSAADGGGCPCQLGPVRE